MRWRYAKDKWFKWAAVAGEDGNLDFLCIYWIGNDYLTEICKGRFGHGVGGGGEARGGRGMLVHGGGGGGRGVLGGGGGCCGRGEGGRGMLVHGSVGGRGVMGVSGLIN